ncbi:stage II sporulation protein M [Paenibacillus sp. 481]|uniref:stage II sporulation protein M n=1 Tax=Paenibacillus sp. 481 TaxID=2835869 RepID=UPI001E30DB95|nr:stage II sporulation protein M [Paenibacillus sp. 481]UHA72410.1 stage II sporulation protein M [Paenibacillus sp. 481]
MKSVLTRVWAQEKKRILLSAVLLCTGIILGLFLGHQVNIKPNMYVQPEHMEWHTYATNNIRTAFIIAASGILLSVPTIFILFSNGLIIGFVIALSSAVHSYPTILAGLLPHGLLEIPALLLAGAIGLKPLSLIVRRIKYGEKIKWITEALNSARLFLVVTALLIVASLIEANITPYIMDWTR